MILGIVVIVDAYVGVFFFKGKLGNRCRKTQFPVNDNWQINPNLSTLCGENGCPIGLNRLNNLFNY